MQVTISKPAALDVLNENRNRHIVEFGQQMQGWKTAMEQYGKDLASWSSKESEDVFAKDTGEERPAEPDRPVSFVDTYDRLIELIGANVTNIIQVSEHEYDQIMNNKFSWTGIFMSNSTAYIGGVRS